jgi:hypothetical protein
MRDKTFEDFDHLFEEDLDGFKVNAEQLKEMIDNGLVDTISMVNNRPGGDKILEHLRNFPFAYAVVDQGTITFVIGTVPKDITKEQLAVWINNVLYDLMPADEAEFDPNTGEFRFWWD